MVMRKCLLLIGIALNLTPRVLTAQIIADRTQVLLKLTPRPSEHTVRDREVFFDQKATLRVNAHAADNSVTNAQIQCVFLYDEVQTSGKIKRKTFIDIIPCKLEKGEEKAFDSKDLRMTGKITRDGQLIGMKFLGSGTRVYEDGKLAYELYQPKEIQKDISGLVPGLDQQPAPKQLIAKADAKPTSTVPVQSIVSPTNEEKPKVVTQDIPAQIQPVEKTSPSIKTVEAVLDLFGYKFSTEEADKALHAVNGLTEEALISQIGLSKQAAHNLVLKRPFQKLEELPKVSYVKKQAIETLKLYVLKK
jgi:hypothetical protein